MKTCAVREGMIPPARMEIFEQMRTIVGIIPDLEPSHLVSCHVVTRVVAHVVGGPLEVVDGWFAGKGYEHLWIDLGGNVIADLYPIGGAWVIRHIRLIRSSIKRICRR